jgi:hypothetical protein
MPRRSPHARPDPLTHLDRTLEFQVLWHRVSIDTSSATPEVESALAYLTNSAVHAFEPVSSMSYVVAAVSPGEESSSSSGHARGITVFEEGDLLATVADAQGVLDVVYRRMYQRAFELASLRGWVRIHAATVDLPSGRALISAASGAGKTTLACALRMAGADVPADESVLVRGGQAIPVPRRFHVKVPVGASLPSLGPIVEDSPKLADGSVAAIDPLALGGDWVIYERPVQAVYMLKRSSDSSVQHLAAVEAMPLLIDGCFRNQEPTGDVFRAAASIARSTTCHRLLVDSPVDAASLLLS